MEASMRSQNSNIHLCFILMLLLFTQIKIIFLLFPVYLFFVFLNLSIHILLHIYLFLICLFILIVGSVQFSSVAQSCPTLCDPMSHSTPGLPVHHQLLEFTQTHILITIDKGLVTFPFFWHSSLFF